MTPIELANKIRDNVFSDRGDDVAEAIRFAHQVAWANGNGMAAITALHVVLNTIANAVINQLEVTV